MITKKTYKLVKSDIPVIRNRVVLKDPNVGGIKLVYDVIEQKFKEINIFGHKIPNIFPFYIAKKRQVLLRPYKDIWDKSRNRLTRNFWGKKADPLTALWIELEFDYKSLDETIPILKEQILDHQVLKHLKRAEEQFSIIYY